MPRSLRSVMELVFWWVFCTEHQCLLSEVRTGVCMQTLPYHQLWLFYLADTLSSLLKWFDAEITVVSYLKIAFHMGIVFTANMKYLCIPNVACLCFLKVPAVVLKIAKPEIIVLILVLNILFMFIKTNVKSVWKFLAGMIWKGVDTLCICIPCIVEVLVSV